MQLQMDKFQFSSYHRKAGFLQLSLISRCKTLNGQKYSIYEGRIRVN